MIPIASPDSAPAIRVVCIHGAGGGGWEWGTWTRVLAAHRLPVLAPDLLPAPDGLASTHLHDYRAQAIGWCRETGDARSRLVLAGASLCGLLALSIAAEVRAAALVLINPMPLAGVISKPLGKPYPALVRWGSERSIASTLRALPDADDATRLHAFRRWRDESGVALEQARIGIGVAMPCCPVLVMASELDDEVPMVVSRALATRYAADFERLRDCSHAGPLLGVKAAGIAERAVAWLDDRVARPA